jgi:large subunit ribosomal protein L4
METPKFLDNETNKKKAIGLIHKVYLIQLKNKRKHTASTKTKSEVRGGGKKPWRQKGTGQARAGSIRSPLWVGGGVSFGPKPRIVSKKVNKKERKLAILAALYLKRNCFQFVNDNRFENISILKTKLFKKSIEELKLNPEKKVLIIVSKVFKDSWIVARNLKNVEIITVDCLSLGSILNSNIIILSDQNLELINQKYGKSHL